jgi:hypothetical protein
MIRIFTLAIAFSSILLFNHPASAQWTKEDLGKSFPMPDGNSYELQQLNSQIVVLVILSTDCHLTSEYIPVLNAIQKEFQDYFVVGVFSGKKDSKRRVRKFLKNTPARFTTIIDKDLYLAGKFTCTMVPEALILGPQGQLGYRGAIDDRVNNDGSLNKEAKRKYVRNALWQIEDGELINDPEITATGCELSK